MATTTNELWYRIASLVYNAILPALIAVIHNDDNDSTYRGLPRNDVDLYNSLNTTHKKTIDRLRNKKLIPQDQYDTLLPSSGTTDSSSFDVSLAYFVIRNLLGLKTKTGWDVKNLSKKNEVSIAAFVMRGKEIRNFLSHNTPSSITQQMFDNQWQEGEDVINGLKYTGCDLNDLKVAPLDGPAMIKLEARVKGNEVRLDTVEDRVDTMKNDIDTLVDTTKKDIDTAKKDIDTAKEDIDTAKEDIDTAKKNIDTLNRQSKTLSILQEDLKTKVDSLSMILGIVHPKNKHLLHVDISEKSVRRKLKKIKEGIHHLKMKDFNLSNHQLERIIIRLTNKFAPSEGQSNVTVDTTNGIDKALETVQSSALSALSSGLGYCKQIQCIKIVLITDCFYVLNSLSSLHDIKSDEVEVFAERLKIAKDLCESNLSKLNDITQVNDYLSNKLFSGLNESFSQKWRRKISMGMNKSVFAREVITINICMRFFFQYYEEKLEKATKEENERKMTQKLKNLIKKNKSGRPTLSSSTDSIITNEISSTTLQLQENIIYIGAAFSVIKKDAALAQMVDHYIMNHPTEKYESYNLVKRYLQETKGVQKAVKNKKEKAVSQADRKEGKNGPVGSLKIFQALAVRSATESFMPLTSYDTMGSSKGLSIGTSRLTLNGERSLDIEIGPSGIEN